MIESNGNLPLPRKTPNRLNPQRCFSHLPPSIGNRLSTTIPFIYQPQFIIAPHRKKNIPDLEHAIGTSSSDTNNIDIFNSWVLIPVKHPLPYFFLITAGNTDTRNLIHQYPLTHRLKFFRKHCPEDHFWNVQKKLSVFDHIYLNIVLSPPSYHQSSCSQ